MSEKSLYQLLVTDPLDERELNSRYQDYLNKDLQSEEGKVAVSQIKQALKNYLENGDESFFVLLDEYARFYDEISFADFVKDEVEGALIDHTFLNVIKRILLEAKTFSSVYFALFLTNLQPSIKDDELDKILKVMMKHFYFAQHILPIYEEDPDYLKIAHEAHYSLISDSAVGSVDFYLTYKNDNKTVYYKLCNEEKENYFDIENTIITIVIENINLFNNEDKLLELIKRYNTSLYSFDEVCALVNDFDNFFKEEKNIKACLKVANKEFSAHFKDYPYIFNFIMTLITRCYDRNTFKFALGLLMIIQGNYPNENYYNFLRKCALSNDFSYYALNALSIHPNFQKQLYSLSKEAKNNPFVMSEIINRLDLNIKKNMALIKKMYAKRMLQPDTTLNLVNRLDILKEVKDPLLSKDEAEFVASLLFNLSFVIVKPIIQEVNNYKDIIINFYNNFVNTHFIDAHELSVQLLLIFEKDEFKDDDIVSTILSGIVYEDEIDYIDSLLNDRHPRLEQVALMMKYYHYYPFDRIRQLIKTHPLDYAPALTLFMIDSNDEQMNDFVDECLNVIDNKITKIMQKKGGDDYENDLILCTLGRMIEQIKHYYPNIFYIGLKNDNPLVRGTFLQTLKIVQENELLDDDKIDGILDSIIKSDDEQCAQLAKAIKDNKIVS